LNHLKPIYPFPELEEITDRHRQEKKELRNKIIALKRTSAKKDKKKLQDEIAQMEADLIAKHSEELAKLTINDAVTEELPEKVEVEGEESEHPQRISKAQKRRNKKEEDAKRREIELAQAEEDNKNSVRNLETKAINTILKNRKLSLHSIKSDGDCMYAALVHQLSLCGVAETVESLRKTAAEYIRANKDELICYMTSAKSDDIMSEEEFMEYCRQVDCTKAWGSQVEISALSNSLKVKIEVLQASGSPTISGGDFKNRPHLIVTYHRHFFGLGEHYNSTKPLVDGDEADAE
jgi:OTU domain-containing protein 6